MFGFTNGFTKVMNVHTSVGTRSNRLSKEFWDRYDKKLKGCNFDENQRMQLLADLHDTVDRLCAENVLIRETTCTWWQDNILYFKPSRLVTKEITAEQRASLFVMHAKDEHSRIQVVFDISDISWSQASRLSYNASYSNLLDASRLWLTIPHSVDKIHLICPSDAKFNVMKRLATKFLSGKLRTRLYVCSDLSEIDTNVDTGALTE